LFFRPGRDVVDHATPGQFFDKVHFQYQLFSLFGLYLHLGCICRQAST
jgi:hypothetical protein